MASSLQHSQRQKGQALQQEAASLLKKSTWFSSSTQQKQEDAAELFSRAGTAFKLGGCHREAAEAFEKSADLYKAVKMVGEASKSLGEAGTAYKKCAEEEATNDTNDPMTPANRAIRCWTEAVTLLCDAGRLTPAAKLSKEIAEMFENATNSDNPSIMAAIESYQQAAQLFEMDNSKSQSSLCLQKIAELSSGALDPPDLLKAADIYEKLGRACLESNLLKYNAKTHFLNGVLCHLANGDCIGAKQAYGRFDSLDYSFGDSREGKFAVQLMETVENYDGEAFATVCFEFDRISKLDPWRTSMLVKVKRGIGEETGMGGDAANGEGDVDLT